MGATSFIQPVPSPQPPPPSSSPSSHYVTMMNINLNVNMAMCSSQHHHHHAFNNSGTPHKSLSLRLPDDMYAWLESMAVEYNYGSVHKCIRDLLAWACTGERDDLDWVFQTSHHHPFSSSTSTSSSSSSTITSSPSSSSSSSTLMLNNKCIIPSPCSSAEYYDTDALAIVGKQACARLESSPMVAINARVSDLLYTFVVDIVNHYHLTGPSNVVERIVGCAVELHAAHDIFDSHESGHDLAESTAELYLDLGLIRYVDTTTSAAAGGRGPGVMNRHQLPTSLH